MTHVSKHFRREEFLCRCGNCGFDTVDIELIKLLENIRAHFGNRDVQVNSGCRCEAHNKAEGGSKKSQHLYGRAADIFIMAVPPATIAAYIDSKWPNKYGVGIYNSWIHIDSRSGPAARWG